MSFSLVNDDEWVSTYNAVFPAKLTAKSGTAYSWVEQAFNPRTEVYEDASPARWGDIALTPPLNPAYGANLDDVDVTDTPLVWMRFRSIVSGIETWEFFPGLPGVPTAFAVISEHIPAASGTALGNWLAVLSTWDQTTLAWVAGEVVWLKSPSGEPLVKNYRYLCRPSGFLLTDLAAAPPYTDRPLYIAQQDTGPFHAERVGSELDGTWAAQLATWNGTTWDLGITIRLLMPNGEEPVTGTRYMVRATGKAQSNVPVYAAQQTTTVSLPSTGVYDYFGVPQVTLAEFTALHFDLYSGFHVWPSPYGTDSTAKTVNIGIRPAGTVPPAESDYSLYAGGIMTNGGQTLLGEKTWSNMQTHSAVVVHSYNIPLQFMSASSTTLPVADVRVASNGIKIQGQNTAVTAYTFVEIVAGSVTFGGNTRPELMIQVAASDASFFTLAPPGDAYPGVSGLYNNGVFLSGLCVIPGVSLDASLGTLSGILDEAHGGTGQSSFAAALTAAGGGTGGF